MKSIITSALLCFCISAYAQEENKLKFSAYAESYYTYDFNSPNDNNRPSFIYSHNRHNEVNLNLGFVKTAYDDGKIRSNLALMAGTYTNANLAAEPGVLKNIFEANAGVKLSKQKNLWLDAGIFPSHIGFESALSKDCWVLTRNISSENTPYYEVGAKLSYTTDNAKFAVSGLYLNGWQRMARQDGNSKPAFGMQVTLKPNAHLTLNYSNYLGSEGADSIGVKRFYNNFYAIWQLTEKLGVTGGFDLGHQQKSKGSDQHARILSPIIIVRSQLHPKMYLAGRYEYYQDKSNILVSAGNVSGFKTCGYSLNIDYLPVANAMIRLEGKWYHSPNTVFIRDSHLVNDNASITTSIAVSF